MRKLMVIKDSAPQLLSYPKSFLPEPTLTCKSQIVHFHIKVL